MHNTFFKSFMMGIMHTLCCIISGTYNCISFSPVSPYLHLTDSPPLTLLPSYLLTSLQRHS